MTPEMDRPCNPNGEGGRLYPKVSGKPEVKRPLVRPRYRCEDSIEWDLRKVGARVETWVAIVQDIIQFRKFVSLGE